MWMDGGQFRGGFGKGCTSDSSMGWKYVQYMVVIYIEKIGTTADGGNGWKE